MLSIRIVPQVLSVALDIATLLMLEDANGKAWIGVTVFISSSTLTPVYDIGLY